MKPNLLINQSFLSRNSKPTEHGRPMKVIQPKLRVNTPGDVYEQEADAIADRVIRMPAHGANAKPITGLIGRSVQRKCTSCEEEKKKGGTVMRKAAPGNDSANVSPAFSSALNATRGSGSPLPAETRNFMESAFSVDFSGVRVHADSMAAEMSRGINAKAFTYGNDIYFNQGEFNPNSIKGKHLLGHELTHVMQQNEKITPKLVRRVTDMDLGAKAEKLEKIKNAELSYELQDAPVSSDSKKRVSMWLQNHVSTIEAAEARFQVDRRAIAGAIAWEAIENIRSALTPSSIGPGKVHIYKDLDKIYKHPIDDFFNQDTVAKQVEDKGYVPKQTFEDRKKLLSTTEGAITYIGAIMKAGADVAKEIEGIDISGDPLILSWFYNSKDIPGWREHLKNRKAGTPFDTSGNPMSLWVRDNLGLLETAVGKPALNVSVLKKVPLQKYPDSVVGAKNMYEHALESEAEHMAESVASSPVRPAIKSAQMQIDRFVEGHFSNAQVLPSSVERVLAMPGTPLELGLRLCMEQRFGYNFMPVRVHTDTSAEQSARDVNAKAYTAGSDIVFGPSQFEPQTDEGRRLIAHELTHVIQQSHNSVAVPIMATKALHDSNECEAVLLTDIVIRGALVPIASPVPYGALQRQQVDPSAIIPKPEWEQRLDSEAQKNGWQDWNEFRTTSIKTFPNIFLGLTVVAHQNLIDKLIKAQSALAAKGLDSASKFGIHSISAFQSPGYTGFHSFGVAIDIDVATNPYVMHEANENNLDKEIAKVYERIAQFILGKPSIVLGGLPGLSSMPGEAFDKLKKESGAMKQYFQYIQNTQDLNMYLNKPDGFSRANLPSTFRTVLNAFDPYEPIHEDLSDLFSRSLVSERKVDFIRRQMMQDWVTLTGGEGLNVTPLSPALYPGDPLQNFSLYPRAHRPAPDDPKKGQADRPFDDKQGRYTGRSPLAGFLNLDKELVLALVGAGLTWGAIGFGAESGDIMHFDTRARPQK